MASLRSVDSSSSPPVARLGAGMSFVSGPDFRFLRVMKASIEISGADVFSYSFWEKVALVFGSPSDHGGG